MRHRRASLLLLLAGTAACATARPGTPGGPALEYGLPDPPAMTYAFSDTTHVVVEMKAMGDMEIVSAQSGIAEIGFRREGQGEEAGAAGGAGAGPGGGLIEATVRVPSYSGRFENAAQGAVSADERDIDGGWTVRLDGGGIVAVVTRPALSPEALQVAGEESLVHLLFARLPGSPVVPGATWVDTVTVREEAEGVVSRSRRIVTSTLAGDSVVGGERLLLIRTSSVVELEMEGAAGGVEVRELLAGTTRGGALWDPRRSVLVERWEDGTLEGTLALPGAGVAGIPVTATIRRNVSERR